jgi:hypothetical protein
VTTIELWLTYSANTETLTASQVRLVMKVRRGNINSATLIDANNQLAHGVEGKDSYLL